MRLTLFTDHKCNFRCTYCYNGEKFSRAMTPEVAFRAVDMVLEDKKPLKQVGFFGGEPLMSWDLIQEVTAYVRSRTRDYEKPVTMVVTTNGSLLNQARIDWLKANNFHLGVSIDGTPAAQDACRVFPGDQGTHQAVEEGIRLITENDVPLKTISVVDPANVDELPDSLDHLVSLGIRDMSFNLNYEGDWNEANRARFEARLAEFTDRYIETFRRGVVIRVNILDAKVITHLKGGFACTDRCDFGCEELAVAPSGRLYPCDRLIGEDERMDVVIGDVWEGVDPVRRDALIHAKNAVLDECRECDLQHRCMHWCGCVNYAMTGSVGEVSGLLCWFEQNLISQADRAAELLYKEKNPAFIKRFYSFALK